MIVDVTKCESAKEMPCLTIFIRLGKMFLFDYLVSGEEDN